MDEILEMIFGTDLPKPGPDLLQTVRAAVDRALDDDDKAMRLVGHTATELHGLATTRRMYRQVLAEKAVEAILERA